MYGKVKIGQKECEMVANAATAVRLRQVFHRDLLKSFSLAYQGKEEMETEMLEMMAYIMNLQATNGDFKKVNEDTFIEWLEKFSQTDLTAALPEILNIYEAMDKQTSISKNPETQQIES